MNNNTYRLSLYIIILVTYIIAISIASYYSIYSIYAIAFMLLGLGWFFETFYFDKHRKEKLCSEVYKLGCISINGRLIISDQLSLSNNQCLADLPHGDYLVTVEIIADKQDLYVAGLSLTGNKKWHLPRNQKIFITVDTGFLIFIGVDKTKSILNSICDAQSKILCSNNRICDVEIVYNENKAVGLVAYTGYGDGQYDIMLSVNNNGEAEIISRFI